MREFVWFRHYDGRALWIDPERVVEILNEEDEPSACLLLFATGHGERVIGDAHNVMERLGICERATSCSGREAAP